MAKTIKNPVHVELIFSVEDGAIELESRAQYQVHCSECSYTIGKSVELAHTPAQEEQIKQFALTAWLPQIKENEEII